MLEEGKAGKCFFLHGCAREERESNKAVCESVCMRTLWSPPSVLRVSGKFFFQSVHFLVSSFEKTIEFFVSDPRGCFLFIFHLMPHSLVFFVTPTILRTLFSYPHKLLLCIPAGKTINKYLGGSKEAW